MMENETQQELPPLPASPLPPRKTWIDRVQALFEVLLLSGLVSSLLAIMPFVARGIGRNVLLSNVPTLASYLLLESCVTFALLYLVMRAHGESMRKLGLSWVRWRPNVFTGFAIVLVLFFLNLILSLAFQKFLPKYYMEQNPLAEIIHTPRDLYLLIGAALIAGGIKEELQRAFILRRFQTHLGGAGLGLVLWSAAFGLGHSVQGVEGVVAASIFGLIFGAVYLIRNNLVAPMVAHAVYDTLALLGYWFVMHNARM